MRAVIAALCLTVAGAGIATAHEKDASVQAQPGASGGGEDAGPDADPLFAPPGKWFSIRFPGTPVARSGRYSAYDAAGKRVPVPASIFRLSRDGNDYQVTVAELGGTAAEDRRALENTIAAFRRDHDVGLDVPTSQNLESSGFQVCGRHFGYGRKRRLHYVTLFYNPTERFLYDVASSVPEAGQAEYGSAVVHFQQTLALQANPSAKLPDPPSYPDNWLSYQAIDSRFTIRFPAPPDVTQGSYRTAGGVTVPSTTYAARHGAVLYRVTVANLWESEADTPAAVEEGATVWKGQGAVSSDSDVARRHTQCGRDITLRTPEGKQAHAWIFFPSSQHRLYVIETVREDGSPIDPEDDRRFHTSFVLAKPE